MWGVEQPCYLEWYGKINEQCGPNISLQQKSSVLTVPQPSGSGAKCKEKINTLQILFDLPSYSLTSYIYKYSLYGHIQASTGRSTDS
jgi:hypothetical protein